MLFYRIGEDFLSSELDAVCDFLCVTLGRRFCVCGERPVIFVTESSKVSLRKVCEKTVSYISSKRIPTLFEIFISQAFHRYIRKT